MQSGKAQVQEVGGNPTEDQKHLYVKSNEGKRGGRCNQAKVKHCQHGKYWFVHSFFVDLPIIGRGLFTEWHITTYIVKPLSRMNKSLDSLIAPLFIDVSRIQRVPWNLNENIIFLVERNFTTSEIQFCAKWYSWPNKGENCDVTLPW